MPVRQIVNAPLLSPPRYGLIAAAAAPPSSEGDQWINGMTWLPEICSGGGAVSVCNPTNKTIDDGPDAMEYDPFAIWIGDKCTTLSNTDKAARARRALANKESQLIASELWRGDIAQLEGSPNAFLAGPDTDILSASPVAIKDAFSGIDQERSVCGAGRTMIHVTISLGDLLASLQLIRREGNLWLSPVDSIVVIDAGYDGSDPDGDVDGSGNTQYMYATPLVTVRRGEIDVLGANAVEGINRADNTWGAIAERAAAATYDNCCVKGINVDIRTRG